MSQDKVGSTKGGFLVIALQSSGESDKPVPQWGFSHCETEAEATEKATNFAAQEGGYQAFVIPAIGHFYRAFDTRRPRKF